MCYIITSVNPLSTKDSFGFDGDYRRRRGNRTRTTAPRHTRGRLLPAVNVIQTRRTSVSTDRIRHIFR
jgi:hypothetical protein